MSKIVRFPQPEARRSIVTHTCIQVSRYPCDDGTHSYAVEVLFPDGTWKILHRSPDIDEAWRLAGKEAGERQVSLLADSLWPDRSSAQA